MSGFSTPAGQIVGSATNNNAAAGKVGEYIESILANASATSLTTLTDKTVTSISLTAGDWDVSGQVSYKTPASTSITFAIASVSLVNNTIDITAGRIAGGFMAAVVPGAANSALAYAVGPVRISLAATTTVYVVASAVFSVSTLTAYGMIRARRVR